MSHEPAERPVPARDLVEATVIAIIAGALVLAIVAVIRVLLVLGGAP